MWLSEPWLGVGVYLGSQGLARISLRGWVRSEGGLWILRPLQSRVEAQLSSAAGLYDVVLPSLPLGRRAPVPTACSGSMQFGVQSTQVLS